MRTKDEILVDARRDIINPDYAGREPYWLEFRKIEVLIDIRDIFNRWPQPVDKINTMLDDGD